MAAPPDRGGDMSNVKIDRKAILLRACYDMLKKQEHARCVISPFETTVFYDGADCDGYCLVEDIAIELEIDD